MRESITEILIRRDKMSVTEAATLLNEAKDQFNAYLDDGDLDLAEDICMEYFGLEPDYLDEFY